MSASRKYERNACFYLWIYYKDNSGPALMPLPRNKPLTLPESGKIYKTTLKNVKVYISELILSDQLISKVELERATHIGSFERRKSENGED